MTNGIPTLGTREDICLIIIILDDNNRGVSHNFFILILKIDRMALVGARCSIKASVEKLNRV